MKQNFLPRVAGVALKGQIYKIADIYFLPRYAGVIFPSHRKVFKGVFMTLLSNIKNYMPNKSKHVYTKYFLCVYIELPNGSRKWYRVGSKLYYAMNSYKKKHGHLPYKEMKNAFIVIPLTPYFAGNKASMGVGKIIRFKYKKVPNTVLCCRSQFVLSSALDNNLYTAYKYLRHDYGRFSRLQIFINLYNWKHNKI